MSCLSPGTATPSSIRDSSQDVQTPLPVVYNSYLQATSLLFDFITVSAFPWTWSLMLLWSICVGVLPSLAMLGCETVPLETLEPVGCLSFTFLKISRQVRAE